MAIGYGILMLLGTFYTKQTLRLRGKAKNAIASSDVTKAPLSHAEIKQKSFRSTPRGGHNLASY